MKLKYEFGYVPYGNIINAVPLCSGADEFHGVLKISPSAEEIMRLLATDTSIDEITKNLSKKYEESSEGEIRQAVTDFVNTLKKEGLICED